jgi:hypothetical protein
MICSPGCRHACRNNNSHRALHVAIDRYRLNQIAYITMHTVSTRVYPDRHRGEDTVTPHWWAATERLCLDVEEGVFHGGDRRLVALQWSRDICRASWLAFAIAPGPQILAVYLEICSTIAGMTAAPPKRPAGQMERLAHSLRRAARSRASKPRSRRA